MVRRSRTAALDRKNRRGRKYRRRRTAGAEPEVTEVPDRYAEPEDTERLRWDGLAGWSGGAGTLRWTGRGGWDGWWDK